MKYKIYGDDFFSRPFVRRLDLPEDPSASDVLKVIGKFWNTVKFHRAADRPDDVFLAKDKNGCLSLFIKKDVAIRRLGTLLPETHPVYNYDTMLKNIHKMKSVRIAPFLTSIKYLLDNISDYV